MGTNTIPVAVGGTTIPITDHNSIRTAMIGAWVPRNSSAVAADAAGDLGTSSIKWNNAYCNTYNVGDTASGLAITENASNELSLEVGGSEVSKFDANGLNGEGIKDATIPKGKMVGLGQQTSSSLFSTSSTTFTATSHSITITTTGRPVLVLFYPDGGAATSSFNIVNSSSLTSMAGDLRILRGSTPIGGGTVSIVDSGGPTSLQVSSGFSIVKLDAVSSGTYTYTVQVKTNSSSIIFSGQSIWTLAAWEL